jgi:hypothetical protein
MRVLKAVPITSAVAVAKPMYPSSYVLEVDTVMVSKMAAKGAPSTSVIAAAITLVISKPVGTPGKSRLMARAIIVEANNVGNIGPPRYPLLNESPRRRTFRIAKPSNISTPYATGLARIG